MKVLAIMRLILGVILILSFGACAREYEGAEAEMKGSGKVIRERFEEIGFSGISSESQIDVIISQADTFGIWLEIDDNLMNEVVLDVDNGLLHVSFKDNSKIYSPTKALLYVSAPLWKTFMILNDGSIKAENDLKAKDLTIMNSGTGSLALKGNATTVVVQLTESGNILNFPLSATSYTISSTGSGKIECSPSSSLTVSIRGSGNVYYMGNPKITQIIRGSGQLIKAG